MKSTDDGGRGGWRVETAFGLEIIRCVLLEGVPGVGHAFSTRRRDDGSVAPAGDGAGGVHSDRTTREPLLRAVGAAGETLVEVRQVHGNRVVAAAEATVGIEADAIVAEAAADRRAIGVRTADCVALLIADVRGRAVAAVHAGWRGTAAGIVSEAVAGLVRLGIPPGDLVAAIGPRIGPCCYPVGAEVARAVADACGGAPGVAWPSGDGWRVDLARGVGVQLAAAGIRAERVSRAPWCTVCEAGWLWSHRRDGAEAGRMRAVIAIGPPGGRP